MSSPWMDRPIRSPSAEQLTPEEFRKLFGLSVEVYDALRQQNGIPAPVKFTAKTMFHPWEHAVYYAFWMRFAAPHVKDKDGKD